MASGIKRGGNRPKTAKHLRTPPSRSFNDTTQEQRDRRHSETDAWAERQRMKPDVHKGTAS